MFKNDFHFLKVDKSNSLIVVIKWHFSHNTDYTHTQNLNESTHYGNESIDAGNGWRRKWTKERPTAQIRIDFV